MFDDTPLSIEEIVDQCRALSLAVIEVSNPAAKEVLTFIQAEKVDLLYRTIDSVEVPEQGEASLH